MSRIAEYRDVQEQMVRMAKLDEKHGPYGRIYRLHHCPVGWYPAGSMARYQEHETWLFRCILADGTTTGQHYRTEIEARQRFARIGIEYSTDQ